MQVLVVDKQPSLTESDLKAGPFCTEAAETVEDAFSMLRHGSYDLVLVNVAAFAENGFQFIRRLRTTRDTTPLIVLTGRPCDERTRALGLGADDAIAQPFDPSELRARITAIVRRNKGFSQSTITVGDVSLCLETRTIKVFGQSMHVSDKEFSVLELLLLRKGTIISKEMFLDCLYGGVDEPEMKIIDVYICKLRRRLERAGLVGFIATVWGRGYMVRDRTLRRHGVMRDAAHSVPRYLIN